MTAFNPKQRAQINAALCVAHEAGKDVAPIQRRAQTIMATGHDPWRAYKAAIGEFAKANPALRPAMARIDALIEASDATTVAKYDSALSTYIRTGDEAAVAGLEPMMRADMTALAVRNGEISADDAAAGRVNWAGLGMGWDDGKPQQFAFATPPQGTAEQRPAPATQAGPIPPALPPGGAGRDAWSNQQGVSARPRASIESDGRAERAWEGVAAPLAGPLPATSI
ncbi:hypothetical protein [Sphingomonas turrisvirgatae]|uniref:Uncharacterized protein n=1 Tax=Sphingomonas turrisvirgatae TaxID=1888892 RepID=A0A1E3LR16_9SPHN|nr:hypothetical protein [Sphingomonas turrisvirgatae]ODP36202.1 hypothetical protein BFL28_07275 [Sphingomonas turrisvirgatae]